MLKLICASIIQCMFLAAGNVFLKLGLEKSGAFSWTWKFFRDFFMNWWMIGSGLSMVAATVIWFYILKNNEISLAYPLISISYIFATIAAIFVFNETVPLTRWLGVLLIMIGVAFLAKSS